MVGQQETVRTRTAKDMESRRTGRKLLPAVRRTQPRKE